MIDAPVIPLLPTEPFHRPGGRNNLEPRVRTARAHLGVLVGALLLVGATLVGLELLLSAVGDGGEDRDRTRAHDDHDAGPDNRRTGAGTGVTAHLCGH